MSAIVVADVEAVIRARVEVALAAELARRDRTRLRVEDQAWVYELVGRLVSEEPTLGGALSEEAWRRIFASVTPLGPLAEHLADPEVEEVRINGAPVNPMRYLRSASAAD